MNKPENAELVAYLEGINLAGVPSSGRFAVVYNYAVTIEVYKDNQRLWQRQKVFRYRRDAEEWAKNTKDDMESRNIMAILSVVRMSDNNIVQSFLTSSASKIKRDLKKNFKRRY